MHLRPVQPSDAPAIAGILAREIAEGYAHFGTEPVDEQALAEEIRTLHRYPFLVAEEGQVLGFARATPHKPRGAYAWTVEVGIYLSLSAQGRGLGKQLVNALLADLEARGFRTVLAGIALPNPASVGLFESLGFAPAGVLPRVGYKHGAWRDVGYWVKHLPAQPDSGQVHSDAGTDPTGSESGPRSGR